MKRKETPNKNDHPKKTKILKENPPEEMEQKESIDFDIEDFLCPITGEVMEDPVIAADGHSYERAAIEKWFRVKPFLTNSPLTNLPLTNYHLQENTALKN